MARGGEVVALRGPTHMAINKCRFKYHGNNCEIWQNNRKDQSRAAAKYSYTQMYTAQGEKSKIEALPIFFFF